MAKLNSIVFVTGLLLLILSAVMGYLSIEELSAMPPADGYKDRGIYTFLLRCFILAFFFSTFYHLFLSVFSGRAQKIGANQNHA